MTAEQIAERREELRSRQGYRWLLGNELGSPAEGDLMAKPRVLVDLSLGHKKLGFSGIPQECRLLFDSFESSTQLNATGLIWSSGGSWHKEPPRDVEGQSLFLGNHLADPRAHLGSRILGKLNRRLGDVAERLVFGRRVSSLLVPVESPAMKQMIWREFFQSTLEPQRRRVLEASAYVLSSSGLWAVNDSASFSLRGPKFDTRGYDFVVFQDCRKARLASGTKKVIRYHDGIPVLASDTVRNANYSRVHISSIKACSQDSEFVCNSPSSRQDLAQLSGKAGDKAVVIPCLVPRMKSVDIGSLKLWDLASTRVSPSTAGKLDGITVARRWYSCAAVTDGSPPIGEKLGLRAPPFILSLATIEPRKNYQGLIRSWQKLRASTGRDVKLAIIGKSGWEFEPILREMRPHVASGTLLHLEGLPQSELQIWYRAATCFAFPSFVEGFGLPPIEAMQCGCPVMVSDIPAHRYSAGEAAVFCDPYDEEDMAAKLDQLTDPDRSAEVAAMVERGYRNADRFSAGTVLPMWEEFFASRMAPNRGWTA